MRFRNRPKWAKPLSARDWKHLVACYTRPTLKQFLTDLNWRDSNGDRVIGCGECAHIANVLRNAGMKI